MKALLLLIALGFAIATQSVINLIAPQQADLISQQTVDAMVLTMSVTETPPATATPYSIIQTAVPTRTPFPTPTLLPTVDFKEQFGEPRVREDFTAGATGFGLGQGESEDEYLKVTIENGIAIIQPKMYGRWRSWRLRPPVMGDGIASVDIRLAKCMADDEAGLILHAPDYSGGKGYYFGLSCSGIAAIYRDDTILKSVDVTKLLAESETGIHHMEAHIQNGKLSYILDGQTVAEAQDNSYPEGYSGFFTQPQYQYSMELELSRFELYY